MKVRCANFILVLYFIPILLLLSVFTQPVDATEFKPKPCGVPLLAQKNLGKEYKDLTPSELSLYSEYLNPLCSPSIKQQPPSKIEFWIIYGPSPHKHNATLVNETEYAYIYWEEGIPVDDSVVLAISEAIDKAFEAQVLSAGGTLGDVPDCDGYSKIFVYAGDLHGEAGGYFNPRDQYANKPI